MIRKGKLYGGWKTVSQPKNFGQKIDVKCRKCGKLREIMIRNLGKTKCVCQAKKKEPNLFKSSELLPIDLSGECYLGHQIVTQRQRITKNIFIQWYGWKRGEPYFSLRLDQKFKIGTGYLELFSVDALLSSIDAHKPLIYVRGHKVLDYLTKKKSLAFFPDLAYNLQRIQPEFEVLNQTHPPLTVIKEILVNRSKEQEEKVWLKEFFDYSEVDKLS